MFGDVHTVSNTVRAAVRESSRCLGTNVTRPSSAFANPITSLHHQNSTYAEQCLHHDRIDTVSLTASPCDPTPALQFGPSKSAATPHDAIMASAPKVKAEPTIKPDPEDASASPAGLSDDDIYEDAGDLEFYNIEENPMAGNVYLTHVPKYLYDAWAHLDDDADIQIGTIRQWNETLPNGQVKQRIALLLDHKNPEHQMIPKEYNLDVKDMQLKNSFLFSEQDLPGFKTRGQGANSNIPAHLRRSQEKPKEKPQEEGGSGHGAGGSGGGGRGGRKGRYQPYYRKAIPSMCLATALQDVVWSRSGLTRMQRKRSSPEDLRTSSTASRHKTPRRSTFSPCAQTMRSSQGRLRNSLEDVASRRMPSRQARTSQRRHLAALW